MTNLRNILLNIKSSIMMPKLGNKILKTISIKKFNGEIERLEMVVA